MARSRLRRGRIGMNRGSATYRPQVVLLEDRLPPGDMLALGAALVGEVESGTVASAQALTANTSLPYGLPLTTATGANASRTFDPGVNLESRNDWQTHSLARARTVLDFDDAQSLPARAVLETIGNPAAGVALTNAADGFARRDSATMMGTGFAAADGPTLVIPADEAFLTALTIGKAVPNVSAAALLSFNQLTGQLAIWGNGDTAREAASPSGFIDITLGGQTHSSDPASASFDPALAGATTQSLTGVNLVGGNGPTTLELGAQSLTHFLAIRADGTVRVNGAINAAGSISIASNGLISLDKAGVLAADHIDIAGRVVVNAGQIHADGVSGGDIAIRAGKVLNGSQITANGTQGDGGTVNISFAGSYIDTALARTEANGLHGGQVTIDGGTSGRLFHSGTREARGVLANGTVSLTSHDTESAGIATAFAGPGAAADFGITPLPNGNVVVTNPHDDFVAPDSGAVFLLKGQNWALESMLVGDAAGDQVGRGASTGDTSGDHSFGTPPGSFFEVGSGGVTVLSNGNFVVSSPYWNSEAGAATWGDGTIGVTGTLDASNSLIGSMPGDLIGAYFRNNNLLSRITALANGNYVVASPQWNGFRGAATWGDGTIGITGQVDSSNSLVGRNSDTVGYGGVTALSNGNYVVRSGLWDGVRGAATWGDGTVGITGTVDSHNSLVGSNASDEIGYDVVALTNGNYVVVSPIWNGGVFGGMGAVTWGDGTMGVTGLVDASNSLVGSHPGDQIGYNGVRSVVTALNNGNFVVASFNWNAERGAITWGDGMIGVTGPVDGANSLIGSNSGDGIGATITPLSNGNFVTSSSGWNASRGEVTWGNGTTGVSGSVDASNSLVGSSPNDYVGAVVTALANGNYAVASAGWQGNRGAITWGNGAAGTIGVVDATNSLVGSNPGSTCADVGRPGDCIGSGGITALSNGNFVVDSPVWNQLRGAVTWEDGTLSTTGVVNANNSLVGTSENDLVGYFGGVTALTNGDYVVASYSWNAYHGAATWGDGTSGVAGAVDSSNSLIGGNRQDSVGAAVKALANGSYVVLSPGWSFGQGAATWGDGSRGITGTVDISNSLVGSAAGDRVGFAVTALTNGNYVVLSHYWNASRGAATWGDGAVGAVGTPDASNSLVGGNAGDQVGVTVINVDGATALNNGNYVVLSPDWNGLRGAATWGDGTTGVAGLVDPSNSLTGTNTDDGVGLYVSALGTGNYIVQSPHWQNYRGAVTWGDGFFGSTVGPVDENNSLVG